MEHTLNTTRPRRFDCYPQSDGSAVVILRENIQKGWHDNEDGATAEFWAADEVQAITDLPESEIEANFDALWVRGETESKTVEERIAELEELLDATMAVALGEEE